MNRLWITGVLLLAAYAPMAAARDVRLELPFTEVVNSVNGKQELDAGVRVYFAGQSHPKAQSTLGEGVANRKTNAVNKTDKEACRWVFLSALKALQADARGHGANAIVEIHSYYKKHEFRSATVFECHAGTIMAGVALKGTYVKLP